MKLIINILTVLVLAGCRTDQHTVGSASDYKLYSPAITLHPELEKKIVQLFGAHIAYVTGFQQHRTDKTDIYWIRYGISARPNHFEPVVHYGHIIIKPLNQNWQHARIYSTSPDFNENNWTQLTVEELMPYLSDIEEQIKTLKKKRASNN